MGAEPTTSSGEPVPEPALETEVGSGASAAPQSPGSPSAAPPLRAVPVGDALSGVEPFPADVLPGPLKRFVSEVAAAIDCPPDFAAVPMFAVLGVAIGKGAVLEVKPNWYESPCLYTGVVAAPGSGKSPALGYVRKPLEKHQSRRDDRVFTTDATIESLALLLRDHPDGLIYVADELAAWVLAMGQYKMKKGADRQHWNSFWASADIAVDRKTSGHIGLQRPLVCVAGCLPPDYLGDLSPPQGQDDGFLDRILFSYPEASRSGWTEDYVSDDAMSDYLDLWEKLRGLGRGEAAPSQSLTVALKGDARDRFTDWAEAHYKRDAPSPSLSGFWSKLDVHCLRLMLTLHMSRAAAGETDGAAIDVESVEGAVALAGYFMSHAEHVHAQLAGGSARSGLGLAVSWIQSRGGIVTKRDLVTHKVCGIGSAADADVLINNLVAAGHGDTREERPEGGGRASTIFELAE